jgi:hypothetical protein
MDVQRRKPLELAVDGRLRAFTLTDWATPDDGGCWQEPWLRWRAARAAWVVEHPNSHGLGDAATRIAVEVQTQVATMRREWSATHGPDDFPLRE